MNNLVNMDIIKVANILTKQRLLIIDDNSHIENLLKFYEKSLKITKCSTKSFRPITRNYNMYFNKFDHVLCPHGLYSIKAKNRNHILNCFVFSMRKQAKLTFALPDIRSFSLEKNNKTTDGKIFKIFDKNDYYKLVYKRKQGNLFSHKEFWYKEILDYPMRIFEEWNDGKQDNSIWKLEDIAVKKTGKFIIYSIDIIKN